MKVKRTAVSAEDQALFLDAVRDAKPLTTRDRLAVPPPPPSPVRVEVLPPEIKLTVEFDGVRYRARAPGVSIAQVAELRSGKMHIEATLDLHGITVGEGVQKLRAFLLESHHLGRRRIRVIHGKGLHSDAGAPLREAVVADLLGAVSGLVRAFASACPSDGGEGATIVVLKGVK
jgi:DNA-nicking Smr family endonuclease